MNELDDTQDSIMANVSMIHKEIGALLDQWDSFEERVSAILRAPVEVADTDDVAATAAYNPSSRLLLEVLDLTDRIRNVRYRIENAKARVQL